MTSCQLNDVATVTLYLNIATKSLIRPLIVYTVVPTLQYARTFTFNAATWTFSSSLRLQLFSLYACCTKTHIRLAYPSLDRNILLILIYNIFDITFLLLCRITQLYKPAFCHAFSKRILIDWLTCMAYKTHWAMVSECWWCSTSVSSVELFTFSIQSS